MHDQGFGTSRSPTWASLQYLSFGHSLLDSHSTHTPALPTSPLHLPLRQTSSPAHVPAHPLMYISNTIHTLANVPCTYQAKQNRCRSRQYGNPQHVSFRLFNQNTNRLPLVEVKVCIPGASFLSLQVNQPSVGLRSLQYLPSAQSSEDRHSKGSTTGLMSPLVSSTRSTLSPDPTIRIPDDEVSRLSPCSPAAF